MHLEGPPAPSGVDDGKAGFDEHEGPDAGLDDEGDVEEEEEEEEDREQPKKEEEKKIVAAVPAVEVRLPEEKVAQQPKAEAKEEKKVKEKEQERGVPAIPSPTPHHTAPTLEETKKESKEEVPVVDVPAVPVDPVALQYAELGYLGFDHRIGVGFYDAGRWVWPLPSLAELRRDLVRLDRREVIHVNDDSAPV